MGGLSSSIEEWEVDAQVLIAAMLMPIRAFVRMIPVHPLVPAVLLGLFRCDRCCDLLTVGRLELFVYLRGPVRGV